MYIAIILVIVGALIVLNAQDSETPNIPPGAGLSTKETVIEYARIIGKRYSINPSVLLAFVEIESQFNPLAVGDGGKSYGLLQIQEVSYQTTILDGYSTVPNWRTGIQENLTVGARYMTWLRRWYKNNYGSNPTPQTLRELWTLGPGKYREGLRMPSEVAKYERAVLNYA